MNATKLSQLKFRPPRRPTAFNFVDPLIVADLAEGVGFRTKGPVLAQRLALVARVSSSGWLATNVMYSCSACSAKFALSLFNTWDVRGREHDLL